MFCPKCGSENIDTNRFCNTCGKNLPDRSQIRRVPVPNFAAPQYPNFVGQVLDGKYRIDSKLGSGGMGDVYRATRLLIGDTVAVKILHAHLARDPLAAERFRREAVMATKLRHRNVVAIYDVGISAANNVPYILMEMAEGFTLRQFIEQYRVLPLDFAVTVITQVCAALDEAHRLGIVHRDIKPENIVANQTTTGWYIKVLDFGIARLYDQGDVGLTQDGEAMGTPQYMSPEQCLGESLDARSDIYSVGIMLFEMLCGTVPFKSPSASATAIHQVQTPPTPPHALNPDIHPEVEGVILKSLVKNREYRQQTAVQLAQELIKAATAAYRSGFTPVASAPIPTPDVIPEFGPTEINEPSEADSAYNAAAPTEVFNLADAEAPVTIQYPAEALETAGVDDPFNAAARTDVFDLADVSVPATVNYPTDAVQPATDAIAFNAAMNAATEVFGPAEIDVLNDTEASTGTEEPPSVAETAAVTSAFKAEGPTEEYDLAGVTEVEANNRPVDTEGPTANYEVGAVTIPFGIAEPLNSEARTEEYDVGEMSAEIEVPAKADEPIIDHEPNDIAGPTEVNSLADANVPVEEAIPAESATVAPVEEVSETVIQPPAGQDTDEEEMLPAELESKYQVPEQRFEDAQAETAVDEIIHEAAIPVLPNFAPEDSVAEILVDSDVPEPASSPGEIIAEQLVAAKTVAFSEEAVAPVIDASTKPDEEFPDKTQAFTADEIVSSPATTPVEETPVPVATDEHIETPEVAKQLPTPPEPADKSAGKGNVLRLVAVATVVVGVFLTVIVAIGGYYYIYMRPTPDVNSNTVEQKPPATPDKQDKQDKPEIPAGMALVPGGEFMMGSDTGDEYSRPAHKVTVKPFYMDITEVTNEEYKKFVDATKYKPPPDWRNGTFSDGRTKFPVTSVNWDDASAYAKWAGKRLPTEEEWEFAARGNDGRLYPWGTDWNPAFANADNQTSGMREVGRGDGRSPFGMLDMSGNAWEWTSSDAKAYTGGKEFAASSKKQKVIRGGYWGSKPDVASSVGRRAYGVTGEPQGYPNTGIRCVKDQEK